MFSKSDLCPWWLLILLKACCLQQIHVSKSRQLECTVYVCIGVCLEGVVFCDSPLHLCACCYGSPEALTYSLMEPPKPPPVNTSTNNLSFCFSPSLSLALSTA